MSSWKLVRQRMFPHTATIMDSWIHGLDVVATEQHRDLPDTSTSREIRYARPPAIPRVGQQSGESKSQKRRMLCNIPFVLLLLVVIFTWLVAASPRRDSPSVPIK